jgi:O-antigen/teichoic acid export membrane protein
MFLTAISAGLFFLLLGRPALSFIFGPEFGAAYLPLLILCAGQLVNAATGCAILLLNMTGNERYPLLATMVAAFLNVMLNLLLIPPYGIHGAAIATASSTAALQLWAGWLAWRRTGIDTTIAYPILQLFRR